MKFYTTILLCAIITFSVASCKKYDDDNTLVSLRKPENRLTQKWKVTYVLENGENVSPKFDTYYYNFQNDGRVIFQYVKYINDLEVPTVEYGNWRLINSDRRLEINFDTLYTDYEILELTKDKLSLKSVNISENRMMYLVRAQ